MAKQKGHIKYVGTLGDVRHFKIKGNKGFFAGLVGGRRQQRSDRRVGRVPVEENTGAEDQEQVQHSLPAACAPGSRGATSPAAWRWAL